MKFLFILLIPFLVSINSVSNYTEKVNRIKCCDFIADWKEEYSQNGYDKIHSMRVDMTYHWKDKLQDYRRRDTIRYPMVREEGDNIKLITQFRYDYNIDNISVEVEDIRRNPIQSQTRKIDSKRTELKARISKKGLYYIVFIGHNLDDKKAYCGSSLFLLRKESKKEIKEHRNTIKSNMYEK